MRLAAPEPPGEQLPPAPVLGVRVPHAGDMGWPLTAVLFGVLIVAWVFFIVRTRPRSGSPGC